ncbi:VanZ family protein [Intestinibacter sp.]|jgi:glycopeptide antibiotics resistance protein|uniref:VanZ family protein n=1 Tax=Intestinibacter sp. TaxID=1965304 RepID=UPI0027DCAFEA|nr:VanZ family protein [uncultured Intestinibacter sp.]
MRLLQVINLARDYLGLGVIGLIFIGIIYILFFRKFLKNHVKANIKKVIVFCILFCYIVIVIGATIFIRAGVYEHANLHLFSSYIEAWNNYSKSYWRNIILNILMFVPFGFLLPLFSEKFKKCYITLSLGFLFTLGIETTQYITKRGIFEVDDIMNNFIGALIGYSLVMFILLIISKEKTKLKSLKLIIYILPTLIAIFAGYKINNAYNMQEFGNLSSNYNYKYDMSKVSLKSNVKIYDNEDKQKMVYKLKRLSADEALEFAENFFEKLETEVDKSNIVIHNNEIMYSSIDDRYKMTVYLNGGVYNFTDYKCNDKLINQDMDEESVKKVLNDYNVGQYNHSQFEQEIEDREKLSSYNFRVDLDEKDNKLIDGYLNINQFNKILSIYNYIYTYNPYGKYKIISEKEAYNKLKEGKFNSYELYNIKSILIRSIKLCYQLDSKGYYQPVYRFECTIDGDGRSIFIPALEDIK